jgi:hypothetical protein
MATETLYPNAAGDSAQCTPVGVANNWDCCDEEPNDGDTTYVKSPNTDEDPHLDLYNIQPTTMPETGIIDSLTVESISRSTSPTYKAYFRIALKKSGGAVQYGGGENPSTSYVTLSKAFAGLTKADLDALQIGIEITSTVHGEIIYTGRQTRVRVVIVYHVPSAAGDFLGDGITFVTP